MSLVLLAVAATLYVFGQYATMSLDDERCQTSSELYFTSTYFVDPDETKWAAYRACLAEVAAPRALWLVGGLVLLSAVALLIYFLRPLWRIRKRKLVAVPEELRETLTELDPGTTFLLDATSTRAGGAAFGNHRRKYVVLNAGMLALHRTEPASFRAIVLHELAHVRADVTTTYATLAIWQAFVAVVLTPYSLILVRELLLADTLSVVASVVALVALVFAARIAVLRAREKHADALVARWTGSPEPYRVVAPSSWFHRWFGLHPSPAARSAVMRDPHSLLRPGFWEVLGCALALQLAWWHARAGLHVVTWYREGNESFVVMRAGWAVLMTALIGLIARRGAAFGTRRGLFALPGLAVGLGLVLGDRLDAYNFDPVTLQTAIAAVVLVGTATLVTVWAGYCATLVRTRWHGWFLGVATTVVTYTLLGWFPEARVATAVWRHHLGPILDFLGGYPESAAEAFALNTVVVPFLLNGNRVLTVASLALIWLVPLVLRREFPRFAALAGAAGGLIAAAVVVLLDSDAEPLVVTAQQTVAVVIVQFLVAIEVSRWADRISALLAAWLAGLVATAAIWLAHWKGTQVDSILATRPHQVLPLLGTIAALAGSLFAVRRVGTAARPWGLVVLAVVSVGVASWWPKAEQTAAPMLPPPPTSTTTQVSTTTTPPPPPKEVDPVEAMRIWKLGGGMERLAAVERANASVWTEAKPDNETNLEPACAALVRIVEDKFSPPPEPKISAMWTQTLQSLGTGAKACVGGIRGDVPDDGTMARELIKGRDQLAELITALR